MTENVSNNMDKYVYLYKTLGRQNYKPDDTNKEKIVECMTNLIINTEFITIDEIIKNIRDINYYNPSNMGYIYCISCEVLKKEYI